MSEQPDELRPRASLFALATAVIGAMVVLIAAGVVGRRDLTAVLSVGLLGLAGVTPVLRRSTQGVLVGLGAAILAVGYGLTASAASASGTLVAGVALVVFLPPAVATLAMVEHERRQKLQPLGDPIASGLRSALGAAAILVFVVFGAITFVHPQNGSGSRDDFSDVARRGRAATAPGTYQAEDSLDTAARFRLSNEVVMRVKADQVDFWRGTTYHKWDGRVWSRKGVASEVGDVDGGSGPDAIDESLLLQTFTIVAGGSNLLFGAYRPVQFISDPTLQRVEDDGTAVVARPLGPGAPYAVVSFRPQVTVAMLRAAGDVPSSVPRSVGVRYLTLPAVPERVAALARDVTAGSATIYDKVQALEAWMAANTTYTLDIPPLPERADSVEQFLFEDRRGFCEQIASSLAVMLRTLGVPTRVAVGYAGGRKPFGSDSFEVRGSDAHAWVEVWFPGVGWQAFDPTASVPLAGEKPASRLNAWLVVALAVVVVLVGGRSVWRMWCTWCRRQQLTWSAQVLAELERAGDRIDRPRQQEETVAEYALALSGAEPYRSLPLTELAAEAGRATFGPPPEPPPSQAGREAAAALRRATPSRREAWLARRATRLEQERLLAERGR